MIKTEITVPVGYSTEDIKSAVAERLPIPVTELGEPLILREMLCVELGREMHYKLTVAFSFSEDREAGLLKMKKKVGSVPDYELNIPNSKLRNRPIIVGSGPAGLFCALALCKGGAQPIILERGQNVDKRKELIKRFETLGLLDPECNVQFGEGGAGTYSDGKLKVGAMDAYKKFVLDSFIAAGAGEEIAYSTSAHLGTDRLPSIIKSVRGKIEELGGEIIFGARLVDIVIENECVRAAKYIRGGERVRIDTDRIILATGHSAHDVFSLLSEKGVAMTSKGFGVGVRLEHPREYINELVYGRDYDRRVGTASYHLVTHLPSGRSVYSFCMCPGGSVVAATSCEGRIVTNGMSEYSRMADNSNAAILVSATPEDFDDGTPLSGLKYQKRIERQAFEAAGRTYRAPSSTIASLYGRGESGEAVTPSYPLGTENVSTHLYLPDYVSDSLREGIIDFDKWMPGYLIDNARITGPETRTTSPIRVHRNERFESDSVKGLYPIGEGAGYAGGIISSATDGVRCAVSVLSET